VPEHLHDTALHPPRRLALAVRDQPFALTPEASALAPLLADLGTTIVPVTVLSNTTSSTGQRGWHAAQQSGLATTMPLGELHQVVGQEPAAGLRQAVETLASDVLALLDPGHGWVNKLFNGSTIDEVLRNTRVPVLLLATQKMPKD
jgi:nucleotide-binding universal stress UspA family protein